MSTPSAPTAPVEVPEAVPVAVTAPEDAPEPAPEDVPEPAPKKLSFILKSNDGEEITVEQEVAFQSNVIKKMVADLQITDPDDKVMSDPLPISNLDGWTLRKIRDWCQAHQGEVFVPKEPYEDQRMTLSEEEKKFLAVNNKQLFALLSVRFFFPFSLKRQYQAADYLEIPALIENITQRMADMATDRSIEELRVVYNLADDFTPKEKEANNKKFEWFND